MKKLLLSLFAITLLFSIGTTSFGQIYMDGDSTDWENYPLLIEAPNNVDDMFPQEVSAVVTDIVDIKSIKAMVIDNTLFGYIEFWGGPVWPNGRYENDTEPPSYYESRGYYRLLLDVDNDYYTGWSTDFFEGRYTPVGYLMTIGDPYPPIGAEIMFELSARMNDDWHLGNEGDDAINELNYRGLDYEEYNGQTDTGSTHLIFNMAVLDADSTKVMKREGNLQINSSDDELLLNDTLSLYWSGHAWGDTFLEFGIELTPFQKYYKHKDGRNVLQSGDAIGLCAWVETSYDDWGMDMTAGGEINIVVDVTDNEHTIIENFNLSQNYPNPFNPSTIIKYSIPFVETLRATSAHVTLKIYDILGREVTTIVNKEQKHGNYEVKFDMSGLGSGIYFYKLQAGNPASSAGQGFVKTMKMILLK